MKHIQKLSLTGLAVLSATMLPGCSEDDVKEALADNNATGLYVGCTGETQTSDLNNPCEDTQRTLVALVQGNKKYHIFYSAINDASEIAGVITGTYELGGGGFSATGSFDYPINGTREITNVSANEPFSVAGFRSLEGGSITAISGSTASFALLSDTDKYNTAFAAPATTYNGSAGSLEGEQTIALALLGDNSFTATLSSGCAITAGSITTTGKALAVVSMTVATDPTNCGTLSAQTLSGVSYFEDGSLYIAALTGDKQDGLFISASLH